MKHSQNSPRTAILCTLTLFLAGTLTASAAASIPVTGIAAWWKGESDTLDSAGTNNAVWSGTAAYGPGMVGTALQLAGTAYVRVPGAPSLDVGDGDGFTVETWIKPAVLNPGMPILEFERFLGSRNPSDVGFHFWVLGTGQLYANLSEPSGVEHSLRTATSLVKAGVWQHLALSYDKTAGVAAIYLNGTVAVSTNIGSFDVETSFANLLIGARTFMGSPTAPSDHFDGLIDELTIYHRALGSNEVASIFSAGADGKTYLPPVPAPAGLVAWWKGDTNVLDTTGVSHGTWQGTPSYVPGKVNDAFQLGNNAYVKVPAGPVLDIGKAPGFTFEAWIKPANNNLNKPLFGYERILGAVQSRDVGAHFWVLGTGALYANLADVNGISHVFGSAAGIIKADAWQHVSLAYDKASGTATFYVDGKTVLQTNIGSFTVESTYTNLLLGARTYMGSAEFPADQFRGALDEVSFYDRALTESEVSTVFQAGYAGKSWQPALAARGPNINPGMAGRFGFQVRGPVGARVIVESSLDMVNWVSVKTNKLGTSPFEFRDMEPATKPYLFYRVRQAP